MSTITKLSPEVIRYYNNITSPEWRNCENTRDVQEWTVQKDAHEITGGAASQQGEQGWDWSYSWSDCSAEVNFVLSKKIPYGPSSRTWTWGSRGVRTPPASGDVNARWRAKISTSVYTGITGMNRYNIIIIKQEIIKPMRPNKPDYEQIRLYRLWLRLHKTSTSKE